MAIPNRIRIMPNGWGSPAASGRKRTSPAMAAFTSTLPITAPPGAGAAR